MGEPTLRQLRLFAALPDHGTLASAAAALHLSESALSQAITALEDAVGEQLCVRRRARGLQLTPTGQAFALKSRQLLRSADALFSELGDRRMPLRGPVRFGCFASLASTLVPSILDAFPKEYPEITIDILVETLDELYPALDDGRLDFAIVYDVDIPPGYSSRTLYRTELQVVLHPEDPLADQPFLTPEMLASQPLIHFDSGPNTQHVHQLFKRAGVAPDIRARVPQIILVQALVARGLGYGILMSRPVPRHQSVEGLEFVTRPLRPVVPSRVIGIWPQRNRLAARGAALLEFSTRLFEASADDEAHRL